MLIRSAMKFGVGGLVGAAATVSVLLGSNFWTYSRLTNEVEIGLIEFQKVDGGYRATLSSPYSEQDEFLLAGDEWQLDTKLIKWKAWATLLGKDPLFQLDRISGRYSNIEQARNGKPTLVALTETSAFDLWSWARDYPDLLFMVDAQYGSSVFLPMHNGAAYRITMSNTGVLARRVENTNE